MEQFIAGGIARCNGGGAVLNVNGAIDAVDGGGVVTTNHCS
jgi:hypothetical protein